MYPKLVFVSIKEKEKEKKVTKSNSSDWPKSVSVMRNDKERKTWSFFSYTDTIITQPSSKNAVTT